MQPNTMTPETVRTLSASALQEHAGWMRGLVARLVHDSARVDDVIQEAWVVALHNPPPAGLPLQAWLSGIIRRSVLATRRKETHQRERETQRTLESARADENVARDVADLSACADEQRALMEAICELPPEQKAVLLLRFYEDLPPREIAARLNAPVNTVRTRQRLGLERLRTQLDQRHGGQSSAWAALLLPLARFVPARAAALGSAGSFLTLSAVTRFLLIGVAVAGLYVAARSLSGPSSAPVLPVVNSSGEALAELSRLAEAAHERSVERVQLDVAPRNATDNARFVFRGRVVDRSGRPIEGVEIGRVSAPRKNMIGAMSTAGTRKGWATSDAAGEFDAAASATDSAQWVRAEHPNYIHPEEASLLRADEVTTITMIRTATTTLEIEVVDAGSGRPCTAFEASSYQWLEPIAKGYAKNSVLNQSGAPTAGRATIEKRFAVDRPLGVSISQVVGMFGEVTREHLRQEVQPIEGGITRVRFVLEFDEPEESGRFPVAHGKVMDAGTGEPIPGVTVSIDGELMTYEEEDLDHSEIRIRRVESGSNGSFRVAIPIGAAEANAHLYHPGYIPCDVELSSDGMSESTYTMKRRGELRCVVLDRAGQPLAGAPIFARIPEIEGDGHDQQLRLFTDESGAFSIPDLLDGRVHVFVLAKAGDSDDDALKHDSFQMRSGVSRDVEIHMDRPERVHVTGTVSMNGRRLRGMVPTFLPYSVEGGLTVAQATPNGFNAGGLERGTYLVALLPEDDGEDAAPITVMPGIVIEGIGAQSLHFEVPQLEVTCRLISGSRPGGVEGLRAVAIPTNAEGFAAELLARPKAVETFGQPVGPETGVFVLPRLSTGSFRLEVWGSGSSPTQPLATQEIQVAGSIRLADWDISPR